MTRPNPAPAASNQPQSPKPEKKTSAEKLQDSKEKRMSKTGAVFSIMLEESIKNNETTTSDFSDWPLKPWLAYDFLAGKAMQIKEEEPKKGTKRKPRTQKKRKNKAKLATLFGPSPDELKDAMTNTEDNQFGLLQLRFGDEKLETLSLWSQAARLGDDARMAWETTYDSEKINAARQQVVTLHKELADRRESRERTGEELQATKQLNAVEGFFRSLKEYVWDDFNKHPEMSVGLVIVAYLVYRTIRKSKLWTITKLAAGGLVAYAFLKSKYNIQPAEWMAEQADRMGWEGGADSIRNTCDTIFRTFGGPEGEKSLSNYYYDKLDIQRSNDQLAFNFLLHQNPEKFLKWYNAADAWSKNATENVPPDVERLVDQMSSGEHVPQSFKEMPIEKRTRTLLRITEKVLIDIAKENSEVTKDLLPSDADGNPLPPTAETGITIVRNKYINGGFFDFVNSEMKQNIQKILDNPNISEETKTRCDDAITESETFCKRMKMGASAMSSHITFLDILNTESGGLEVLGYEGEGTSLIRIRDNLINGMNGLAGKTADAAIDAYRAVSGYVMEIDDSAIAIWEDDIRPLIYKLPEEEGKGLLEKYEENKAAFNKWMYEDDYIVDRVKLADSKYEYIKKTGQHVIVVLDEESEPIREYLKSIGLYGVQALRLGVDNVKDWALSFDERIEILKILITFEVKRDGNSYLYTLGKYKTKADGTLEKNAAGNFIPEVTIPKGYTRIMTATLVPAYDPASGAPNLGPQRPRLIGPSRLKMPDDTVEYEYDVFDETNAAHQGLLVLPAGYYIQTMHVRIDLFDPTTGQAREHAEKKIDDPFDHFMP